VIFRIAAGHDPRGPGVEPSRASRSRSPPRRHRRQPVESIRSTLRAVRPARLAFEYSLEVHATLGPTFPLFTLSSICSRPAARQNRRCVRRVGPPSPEPLSSSGLPIRCPTVVDMATTSRWDISALSSRFVAAVARESLAPSVQPRSSGGLRCSKQLRQQRRLQKH
jgi:hypothetical protein